MAKKEWKCEIIHERLLLVEGTHEVNFFEALLKHLRLNGIQPIPCGGKDQMNNRLSIISKHSAFPEVTHLAIVRDADNNGRAAFQSVCYSLRKNGLSVPTEPLTSVGEQPKVQVLILPSTRQNGSLETLCLQSIEGKPEYTCVESYFACLASKGIVIDRLTDKNRIQVYLAHHEKDFLHTGLAAKEKVWDFNHSAFTILSDFLTEFAS